MSAVSDTPVRRRQWGADERVAPPAAVPPRATTRSIGLNRAAIWVTIVAWAVYSVRTVTRVVLERRPNVDEILPMTLYLVVVTLLTGSAVAYLLARHGFLERSRHHRRALRMDLDGWFAQGAPPLTVIVPSYREDARVVRQTLLSAALQEYPQLSVVLLVDDPPHPGNAEHRRLLAEAVALPDEVMSMLEPGLLAARSALDEFTRSSAGLDPEAPAQLTDLLRLRDAYRSASATLRVLSSSLPRVDHTDSFLADHVIGQLVDDFDAVAAALMFAMQDHGEIAYERVRQLHLRLTRVFDARLSSFQRKRFASLSHEPNKAMNLNSYISLMGNSYRIVTIAGEDHLVREDDASRADLVVPAPEFILTLDADSVLLPEYCLRLVHQLQQPEHERVAVIQTPYSAFPGAPTRLERLAGATTDLQHRVHQGLSHFDATFWVGANAILRRQALDDIATVELEHGRPMVRYIHDRTVIEDTESSIDLGTHDWTLLNYGERLSYSATPPDFGSLAIQRQRWADGGLIILPKLLRTIRRRRREGRAMSHAETFLRVNYLASIAWSSAGLILLLGYPFDQLLLSPLVIAAALPYFLAQAADLAACGYHRRDTLRIYGFNLLLLPVNLAGALRSLGQGITGSKISFARTPKRQNRTATRPLFIVAPLALIAFSGWTLWKDVHHHQWWHAFFSGLNMVSCSMAIVSLVGVGAAIVDVVTGVVRFFYHVPAPKAAAPRPVRDWATVLDLGTGEVA